MMRLRQFPLIGTTISHYKVLRLLGAGGMGEVYEATDEQLARKVAIKILLPKFAEDPEVIARFFNEARSVNLIGHPGLVQVFEFGKMPGGGAFMVMEYIAGVTLRDRLKASSRLAEMEALQISLQLASALAATHAKDIVHRDLKPGNVMILPDPTMPTGERVKLLDFGIAKLGPQSAKEDQLRTKTGLSIGTPAYMSPEQCRGAKTLDGKADVYSLGVMMYQMLAGQLPFDAEADGAILGMQMYEEPQPLLKLAQQVSRPVAALVHRMLRKRAEERPSAQEVAEVLTEMAAAVLPKAARPSAKLQIVASPSQSDQWDVQLQNPSTLGRSAGQLASPPSLRLHHLILRLTERSAWLSQHTTPRQRLLGIGAGALLILSVAIVIIVVGLRSPAAPVVVAQPPKVRWLISSKPAGARVIRKDDQVVLGQTPWTHEAAAALGTQELLLRLDGYKDRPLHLDQGRDLNLNETLEPAASPSAAAESGGRKRGKRGSKVEDLFDSLKRGVSGHRKKGKSSD